MISNISGTISYIDSSRIIVQLSDNFGIAILVPPAYLNDKVLDFQINRLVKLYTQLRIKDEEIILYGFITWEERELFIKLLNISGVGPKIALLIIGSLGVKNFYEAINSSNLLAFKSISGVGDKTAKRILIEFKAQLPTLPEDLFTALANMGFKRSEIYEVWNKLIKDKVDTNMSSEDLIKLFLRQLKR